MTTEILSNIIEIKRPYEFWRIPENEEEAAIRQYYSMYDGEVYNLTTDSSNADKPGVFYYEGLYISKITFEILAEILSQEQYLIINSKGYAERYTQHQIERYNWYGKYLKRLRENEKK